MRLSCFVSHVVAAALVVAGCAPARADSVFWASVSGWDVAWYPSARGCQAYVLLNEDTDFFIGYDNRRDIASLEITLLDPRWTSIDPATTYSVTVTLGDQPPWTLDMSGVRVLDDPGLNILIDATTPETAQFIAEFRRERQMTWAYGDTVLGRFSLRGSRRAMDAVQACEAANSARRPPPSARPATTSPVSTPPGSAARLRPKTSETQ